MKRWLETITIVAIAMALLSPAGVYAQHSHDHGVPSGGTQNDEALMRELDGVDGKKAVEIANQWRSKNIDVVTSVTPDDVIFNFKSGKTVKIPLPDDVMIVSIAPYVNKTHVCKTHYMSKCDGELKNVPVKVKAVTVGGKTLINKTMKTPPTGFIDLWLPRDQEINISVSALGKNAKGKILTYRDSKTCDTTLKLE